MIAWSIIAAKESKLFNEIMVSTDDEEIAEISKEYGAKVPFMRSKETSSDSATTMQVIDEVYCQYNNVDNVCCIYASSPLINKTKISRGYWMLLAKDVDSVIPIVRYSTPIHKAMTIKDDRLQWVYKNKSLDRTQDLPVCYHDAGMFYWMSKKALDKNEILTDNSYYLELSELDAQDIDNFVDLEIAKIKLDKSFNL